MSTLVIEGGQALKGEVLISGMKNAATPLIAAALLTSQDCILNNVPRISDVESMLDILKSLKVKVEWTADRQLTINAAHADLKNINQTAVKKMRSSILLVGPLLSRFKELKILEPGGCIIGKRPIDTHLQALSQLGIQANQTNDSIELNAKKMKSGLVVLSEFSVTATENIIMAAVLAEGKTVVKLAAHEPHVQKLIECLQQMGADIKTLDSSTVIIEGIDSLQGYNFDVISDQIEIGTFLALAAATKSELSLTPVQPEYLDSILSKASEVGVNWELKNDSLKIKQSKNLRAFKLQTMPYPGFPTDLQAPFGVLATQCQGMSLIHDPLYEGRLGYVNELVKMGANATICDPHRVIVAGPSKLRGTNIKTLDLRAGATMVIAGLVAEGKTTIADVEIIDRGYENLDQRLASVGAKIKRID
ncbi:MAG: UDP-N-acetylglucosamine 1-carboxyvinyltransferase [Candidatus Buchananbacteria bacterium CG10_big_fil_rev_8_21_14_0_10_42_9]|uniref:UDP-N-acetylglucosamine 1-carboxyvinyltransferase n=1 Tax=Candidatus Buchananbacteria bacterium CG10_big_fil_rev_8_21_14_0_10_42_9 TaxID=1974526 RepID=A0A2H0W2E3_9BACT|nr:MAG: UDP-N-acetylglucosamine 1-carboxyvinyltransferase [Candidatus Buchananbacteria bacterium CG10_big_fil_rev_8_21_14_0_10_42_9]